jgi:hypothetical protein
MRKLKTTGWEEANSWHKDLFRGIGRHKATPLVHVVEALAKSIASQLPNLFRNSLDSPPSLSHEGSRQVPGHLDPSPLKSFSMKEGDLHIHAQSCRRRSTPSRSVDDLPASHQDSKGPAHRDTSFGSLKNQYTTQLHLAISF